MEQAVSVSQHNPSRRQFLVATGAATAATFGLTTLIKSPAGAAPHFRDYPFNLGVASGDPLPGGVILWTRLAPSPLADDGSAGMPEKDYQVQWQLATDDQFSHVVRRGTEQATPRWGHSVHVELDGLEPSREYYYRFRVGTQISPIGRTKTAPDASAAPARLAFAQASCQNRPDGFYVAHRDMLDHDLDFVLFLGDYIYEGTAQGDLNRGHLPTSECMTLADYRLRHTQYKTDLDLQAVHAAFPWVVTIDDHDVDNNWAGDIDGHDDSAGFLDRRAAAFQALYENLPLRKTSRPSGPNMSWYRQVPYGNLANFFIVDTRQFRDDQPTCDVADRIDGYCPGALDPELSLFGAEQRQWLVDGLANSSARWNIVAHQTRFAPYDIIEGPGVQYGRAQDPWGDGYVAERSEVINAFEDGQVSNPIVLSGDAHRNWAFDLKHDFADENSATVGAEFLCTSVTSGGDRIPTETRFGGTPDNPYEVFTNGQRGYVRFEVTPDALQADFRVADTVRSPDGVLTSGALFAVEDGVPGIQPA